MEELTGIQQRRRANLYFRPTSTKQNGQTSTSALVLTKMPVCGLNRLLTPQQRARSILSVFLPHLNTGRLGDGSTSLLKGRPGRGRTPFRQQKTVWA